MKMKPSLPSGTRDFLPQEVAKRNYIFSVIRSVFEKYGFQQIETPVLENLATLTGKYGDEGDQLLFKVLNSGDYLKDADAETLQNKDSKKLTSKIADRGLRYDLTVPLARYVVQHQNDLVFPFKRYHIAPVWRADRPQKGRYREFYQCDADVIGSNSLLNEVELTQIYLEVFEKLDIGVDVCFSSRNFLIGLADYCGAKNDVARFATILDKNDKIGLIELIDQLNQIGDGSCGNRYKELMSEMTRLNWEVLPAIKYFKDSFVEIKSDIGLTGITEIETVYNSYNPNSGSTKNRLVFTFHLARGLNYYTGIIWEVMINKHVEGNENISIGSIGGGGRYGNLTEMFGGRDMSGVGISFGIERIYDVMEELNLFPKSIGTTTKVLFVHFDEADKEYSFPLVQQLRAKNIASEIYPDKAKMEKQMKYANAKAIPFVVVVGENERNSGQLSVKNMATGEQQSMPFENLTTFLTQ